MTPLDVARAELEEGIREATGRNDGTPAARYMDGDRLPWCGGFVLYCYRAAGTPLPGNRWRNRRVSTLARELEERGHFFAAGELEPEPSDLVFFGDRAGSDAGDGGHVGIVEEVHPDQVITIEGNVHNRVERMVRPLRGGRPIEGFGRWPRQLPPA